MCGLVGMISSSPSGFIYNQEKAFCQLLFMDAIRGDDSTGVFGVNKYGNVDYLKDVTASPRFMESTEFTKFKTSIFQDFHIISGHNRKATRGQVSATNAHPFIEGNKILSHNGTLLNYHSLTKKSVQVDSHAILHSLNERTIEETIEDINGAFALSWYDAEKKEFYLIRNTERPLFIANTPGAWFYASEKGLLEWILPRNNITISEMTECVPGTLYTFKLEDKNNMWMTPLTLFSPKKYVYESKKKKTDTQAFTQNDFIIGTRMTIIGEQVHHVKPNQDGKNRIWCGHWFQDESIKVRIWTSEEELKKIEEQDKTQGSPKQAGYIIAATLAMVMSKNGKITLICKDPSELQVSKDVFNKEIQEDEYMLTDKLCQTCGTQVPFNKLKTGVFTFNNPDNYYICCEDCLSVEFRGIC